MSHGVVGIPKEGSALCGRERGGLLFYFTVMLQVRGSLKKQGTWALPPGRSPPRAIATAGRRHRGPSPPQAAPPQSREPGIPAPPRGPCEMRPPRATLTGAHRSCRPHPGRRRRLEQQPEVRRDASGCTATAGLGGCSRRSRVARRRRGRALPEPAQFAPEPPGRAL
jgi:hypothetical protein